MSAFDLKLDKALRLIEQIDTATAEAQKIAQQAGQDATAQATTKATEDQANIKRQQQKEREDAVKRKRIEDDIAKVDGEIRNIQAKAGDMTTQDTNNMTKLMQQQTTLQSKLKRELELQAATKATNQS